MYYKCLTFEPENIELLDKILNEKSPTKIKKYGRQVKNYNDIIWKDKRYGIMVHALRLKFSQNEDLKQKLLNTNPKILYEASKYDKIWGIGFYANNALNNRKYFGMNLLGKALMEIRNELS
jgi:ribA/ribD-fused uncharacterized protein